MATSRHPGTGRVAFLEGRGEMPMLEITTPWSSAEVYLHGAHITHFQKHGEPPLLFLSQCSRFEAQAPIRGGVPIIFPWFGKPADKTTQHGFARLQDWDLKELYSPADGSVSLRFSLPARPETRPWGADFLITVSDKLAMKLVVVNQSAAAASLENCLHTYFAVGDIDAVKIVGLTGAEYLNQPTQFSRHTETAAAICVAEELDRLYFNTTATVQIRDTSLQRVISVQKEGSRSTVVWNPWMAKAKAMADFGDDEYQRMICVESGNVGPDRLTLEAGGTASLKVVLDSQALLD